MKSQSKNMRRHFADIIHQKMATNSKIWIISGDLGYGVWDRVRKDYPQRFINTGAAEQAMVGIGVGLALEKKIPIVYSIVPFLLYRPFETIRNYINHEKIPVKLIGYPRDKEYFDDGFSHWAPEDKQVMKIFSNIQASWPDAPKAIPELIKKMLTDNQPWYINLSKK